MKSDIDYERSPSAILTQKSITSERMKIDRLTPTPAMLRAIVLLCILTSALIAREFDPRRDAFSFSNDTVLNYEVTPDGRLLTSRKAKSGRPTHCCFLFTRSAMQFWQFARFEPRQPRRSEAEYRTRIIALFKINPWEKRGERKIETALQGDSTYLSLAAFIDNARGRKKPLNNADSARISTLTAMMGRKSIYERRVITWEEMDL